MLYIRDDATDFQNVTKQIQWHACIGWMDDMGRLAEITKMEIFPTKEGAETWLDIQGWRYSSQLLRRHKQGVSYGLAEVRRLEVEDRLLWALPPPPTDIAQTT